MKQIADVLNSNDAKKALSVFQRSIDEIDEEVTALSTIKSILNTFVEKINQSLNTSIKLDFLSDDTLTEIVNTLEITKLKLKEEKTVWDLQAANNKLRKLTDKDVRIIYLPPMTVAACQSDRDEGNEDFCTQKLSEFLFDKNLFSIKHDMRSFGFNIFIEDKMPEPGKASPCWEKWVNIPDDIELPEPLFKRQFRGGLYAAHMIKMGGWDDWDKLVEWCKTSKIIGILAVNLPKHILENDMAPCSHTWNPLLKNT